jgi:hypothetical protein
MSRNIPTQHISVKCDCATCRKPTPTRIIGVEAKIVTSSSIVEGSAFHIKPVSGIGNLVAVSNINRWVAGDSDKTDIPLVKVINVHRATDIYLKGG